MFPGKKNTHSETCGQYFIFRVQLCLKNWLLEAPQGLWLSHGPCSLKGLRSGRNTCPSEAPARPQEDGANQAGPPPPLLAVHPALSLIVFRSPHCPHHMMSPNGVAPVRLSSLFSDLCYSEVSRNTLGLKLNLPTHRLNPASEEASSLTFVAELSPFVMVSTQCLLDIKSECTLAFSATRLSFRWLILLIKSILFQSNWIVESGMKRGPSSTQLSFNADQGLRAICLSRQLF